MVDVVGHLGMALVWLALAWFVLDRAKTAATFVGVGVWFGLLPDADLYLRRVVGTIKHHGITHTIVVVTLVAAVVGPLVGLLLRRTLGDSEWFSPDTTRRTASFGFVMVWVAGLSHIFADMLSAPDIAEAIEPLWPFVQGSVGIDLVWYNDPWFNWGLLVAGVVVNVALYALTTGATTRSAAHSR